uniref:Thiamine transporter 1 n=1 Tax=Cacopsylla melanoneura TaxID=428564 RepID=A0A8D8MDZ1_9HEMI
MESWVKLSIWIGIFGFFKEFRPEDPYIIQYLTGPKMNFTDEQVNQIIFPVSTYTSMIELVFVFLITDWLRYKPVVVVCALSGVIVQIMLIWCRGVTAMQVMEVFYGTMSSTEVAYYTYIYAKVDPQYFQQVTSYMRASVLTGRFLSSVVSQIFLFWKIMTIDELNDLTLVGMICAFFWALGLPSVPRSLYFHREVLPAPNNGSIGVPSESTSNGVHRNGAIPSTTPKTEPPSRSCCSSSSYVLGFLWDDFKFAFTNMYVIKWSVWVAVGTCGYTQFMGYIILFSVPIESPPPIQPRNSH